MRAATNVNDPDRFFRFDGPGSQEWWYFDAISDDGRDALVIVWYAGLPFDPQYGVAALRHLRDPSRFAKPNPLDHGAIGFSHYRDGKTVAYALNGFRASRFSHVADPFAVEVDGNRLERDAEGYLLRIETPAVDGRTRISARLRFRPAAGTVPLERDFGHPGSRHLWCLAAADCAVEGEIASGKHAAPWAFRGRGYHDHNAGELEVSRAMRRWRWGRVHHGPFTEIYYAAEPREGPGSRVWITCQDGRPEAVREGVTFEESEDRGGNVFGVRHGKTLTVSEGSRTLSDPRQTCVDDGPFYRRWVGPITPGDMDGQGEAGRPQGVSELLEARNLNRRLFNWMVGYRLKRPKS